MYFASLHDLLFMNGHGAYVWASYGIGFVVIAALIFQPLLRHKKLRGQILQQNRPEQQHLSQQKHP